jgi:hypothetical protein
MPQDDEVGSITEPVNLENWLFFGNVHDLEEFDSLQRAYFDNTKGTASIRLVVLETWILIDYAIRGLLIAGFQIRGMDHEELDLRYNLLPRGFRECVSLLRKLYAVNRVLPAEPERFLTLSMRAFRFIREFDPGLVDRLLAAENAYLDARNLPGCSAHTMVQLVRYRSVSDDWLDVVARIDGSWESRANKLNAARNLAAHCHDERRIGCKLGFDGSNALVHAKAECWTLARELIGINTLAAGGPTPAEGN